MNYTVGKTIEDKPLEEIKKARLEELEEYKKDGVLESENVFLLSKLIKQGETVEEVEKLFTLSILWRRTGLIFQPTLEKVRGGVISYFSKDEKLSFSSNPEDLTHELIIGDNFEALLNLLVEYRGKIDCIYIDPPYGKDAMGGFAHTNYDNDISRDNLLSMLRPRLDLAKELLSPEGVIFCSIDDKNQAYVELLFNEVFGEKNFVACCPRMTALSVTTKSDHELQKTYDYLLIYTKTPFCSLRKEISGEYDFPFEDARGRYRVVPLQDNGPHGTRTARPNLYYPIYKTPDGRLVLEREGLDDEEFLPTKHKNDDGCWMWSREKFERDNADLVIDKGKVCIKHYYKVGEDTNRYRAYKGWLDQFLNKKFLNKNGTLALSDVLGKGIFDYPKPPELIEWCVNLVPKKDALVLDFFAGSGTTGQAVLELNKKDGGERRFILCTNNLEDDGKIAENVTSRRLKRVMTGSDYDGTSDFPWAKKNEPLGGNLLVLDIDHISDSACPPSPTPFEVIDETLYGKKKFKTAREKISWVCENFDGAEERLKPSLGEEGPEC